MSVKSIKRQSTQVRLDRLAAVIEPIIEGRTNALELSLRQIAQEVGKETGETPHPADVAAALRLLGFETAEGGNVWVKE